MITKSKPKLLLLGCGDIGIRLAHLANDRGYSVSGLRRRADLLPEFIAPLPCDLSDQEQLRQALAPGFDFIVLTLTPTERSEKGYHHTYVHNVGNILQALNKSQIKPAQILFVSSTSVYGHNAGEWVDESSSTEPLSYNGQLLMRAEQQFLNSEYLTSVIRFSGIYGPGRERLINKVKQGDWNPADTHFTNRIHADDCAGVLAFLLEQCRRQTIEKVYLASDNEPAPMNEVCAWMAKQLSVSLPDSNNMQMDSGGNKRCSNQRLRCGGYQFLYPSYREGYLKLLQNS